MIRCLICCLAALSAWAQEKPLAHFHHVPLNSTDPAAAIGDPRVDGACRELAALALDYFAAADLVLRGRPRGRLLAPRLMSAVYRTMLQEMLAEGWAPPRRRVRIAKPRLLWIVVRCSVFGR